MDTTMNAAKEPEIPILLDELEKNLDILEESIIALRARLSRVTRPLDTPPSDKEMERLSSGVEYIENLRNKKEVVVRMINVVQAVLGNLEI